MRRRVAGGGRRAAGRGWSASSSRQRCWDIAHRGQKRGALTKALKEVPRPPPKKLYFEVCKYPDHLSPPAPLRRRTLDWGHWKLNFGGLNAGAISVKLLGRLCELLALAVKVSELFLELPLVLPQRVSLLVQDGIAQEALSRRGRGVVCEQCLLLPLNDQRA